MKGQGHNASDATGHWLLRKESAKRRRIEADAIIDRAHSLVHEGGSEALSMRLLASTLGTSTSALYRHVPSKQWLLIAIVDHVFAEVDTTSAADSETPRERLVRLSSSFRDVLAAHPHLHEILTSHVAITPNTVRIAEAALAALRDLGVDDAQLVDAYNTWCGYVVGFTTIEAKPVELTPDLELQRAMRDQLEGVDVSIYPNLTELMPQVANRGFGLAWLPGKYGGSHGSFEWGLAALLDGFEQRSRR